MNIFFTMSILDIDETVAVLRPSVSPAKVSLVNKKGTRYKRIKMSFGVVCLYGFYTLTYAIKQVGQY